MESDRWLSWRAVGEAATSVQADGVRGRPCRCLGRSGSERTQDRPDAKDQLEHSSWKHIGEDRAALGGASVCGRESPWKVLSRRKQVPLGFLPEPLAAVQRSKVRLGRGR